MGGELTILGNPGSRAGLISEINLAFSRRNIQATAARLGNLTVTGDFLDICKRLGFLDEMDGGDFARYKRELAIPETNRALVTAAFRTALTAQPRPIPLQILIVSGTHEIVTVTGTATEISVVVTRDEARSPAPRKTASRAPRKTASPAPPETAAPAPPKRAARKR
jgi:hypothetical protein